jgi:hypothetical protein
MNLITEWMTEMKRELKRRFESGVIKQYRLNNQKN